MAGHNWAKRACAILSLCAVAAAVSSPSGLLGQDFVGTWKFNPQKSKVSNSSMVDETLKIEKTGPNTFRTMADIVTKAGEHKHFEDNRLCNGQEHPVQGEDLSVGQNSSEICQLLDSSTRKVTLKEGGKVVYVLTSKVSADGNVMTNHETNLRIGRDWVVVYDRQ